jgi:hypothetical protein
MSDPTDPLLEALRERRAELDAMVRDAESRRAEIDRLIAAAEDGRSKLRRSLKGNSGRTPSPNADAGTAEVLPQLENV